MMAPLRAANAKFRWLRCAALALVGTAGAEAQNLIVSNPDFDDDILGWALIATGSRVGSDDFDGCTGGSGSSGSLAVGALPGQFPGDNAFSGGGPDLCFPVLPGETIFTEIAYRSPHVADIFPVFYPQPGCVGTPPNPQADGSFPASAAWNLVSESFTVPGGTASMRLYWYGVNPAGNEFDTSWDRAYIGRSARIFADDFEAGFHCRWSSSVGAPAPDTTPPTAPSPVTSSSHGDGLPHPNPIDVAWGVSVDTESGLAGYRVGLADVVASPACDDLLDFVVGNAGQFESVPPGSWYAYVCAQDNAGNQSAVVVGGPYVVN